MEDINEVKQNYIDKQGERIFDEWLDLYMFIEDVNVDEFTKIVDKTYQYFKQLNTIDNLPMQSDSSISFYSCLRIINLINGFGEYNAVKIDYDYDDYEDLCNYPNSKLQVELKAMKLIAWALSFAISLIPKQKLDSVIGVIYNGESIGYDIGKRDIEAVVKAVANYPYCKN